MPYTRASDGTHLYYETQGTGEAILFAHEFGGDWRSWRLQAEHFARDYLCLRYSARGFYPSSVPQLERYGQDISTSDLFAVADAAGLDKFHLVGLSMGSYTSLMAAVSHPERLLSLTLAGCSSGADDEAGRERYRDDLQQAISLLDSKLGDGYVEWFADDPTYRRLLARYPSRWTTYSDRLRAQSVEGARNTLKTVHWQRKSLFQMKDALKQLDVPTLLIHGDEDHSLIEPTNDFLAGILPCSSHVIMENTGHLVNIEQPKAFNLALALHIRGERLSSLGNNALPR